MAPHSSTLAWTIPWMEEPGWLQSTGSRRDTTEWLHLHFSLSCIGEGNGNPLQWSCLENPRDGGAWWAAIYGVVQSWTRLNRLSSSSRRIKEWTYRDNTVNETNNTLEGINRISEAEEQISELEDKMVEINSEEQNKVKWRKRMEDNFRDLWENVKFTNTQIIGVPEEEDKKRGYEKILKRL